MRAISTASLAAVRPCPAGRSTRSRPSRASTRSAVDAVPAGDADAVSRSDMTLSNRERIDQLPPDPCNRRATPPLGGFGGAPCRENPPNGKKKPPPRPPPQKLPT